MWRCSRGCSLRVNMLEAILLPAIGCTLGG
jgi:hypothetical protein